MTKSFFFFAAPFIAISAFLVTQVARFSSFQLYFLRVTTSLQNMHYPAGKNVLLAAEIDEVE
jgi:hypothetical protein